MKISEEKKQEFLNMLKTFGHKLEALKKLILKDMTEKELAQFEHMIYTFIIYFRTMQELVVKEYEQGENHDISENNI